MEGRRTVPTLGARFEEAVALARRLHEGQVRKGTQVPYLAHVLAVASLVLEEGGDEDETIAALLHDGPEESGGRETLEEIRRRFGDRVADIVDGCTDTYESPKPPWRERKETFIAQLTRAAPAIKLVAAADKLHNLRCLLLDHRDLGDAVFDRFHSGKAGQVWYYRAVVEALREDGPERVVGELDRAVAELERLAIGRTEMSRSPEEISKLFAYNRWATARTLDAVAALSDEEYGRPLGGSYPSVRDTLAHIYAAEWVWLERWNGRSPRALPPGQEVPTLADLRARLREVEDGQTRFLEGLTPARLEQPIMYQNVRGETWTYPLGEMLVHVVNHSSYHRGQVVTMLRQLGKSANPTDYLVYLDRQA